jgi:hypothetical protein
MQTIKPMITKDNSQQFSLFGEYDVNQRTLDELFHRSANLRTTEKFMKFIAFVKKFKRYSIFNNTLVYLQNPEVSYYATASHWYYAFGRYVKPDARPMVILAPMTPVLFVYDLYDTEGEAIPDELENPFPTEGTLDPKIFVKTISNCASYATGVTFKTMSKLKAGFVATTLLLADDTGGKKNLKYRVLINDDFTIEQKHATLCHEIAHLFLGHLGADEDEWWQDRMKLSYNVKELEAEAVSYLVCSRCGLYSMSEEYLSEYINDANDLRLVSIELISKIASQIERMGNEKIPPRKRKKPKTVVKK